MRTSIIGYLLSNWRVITLCPGNKFQIWIKDEWYIFSRRGNKPENKPLNWWAISRKIQKLFGAYGDPYAVWITLPFRNFFSRMIVQHNHAGRLKDCLGPHDMPTSHMRVSLKALGKKTKKKFQIAKRAVYSFFFPISLSHLKIMLSSQILMGWTPIAISIKWCHK